jgi:hypothetical protein
LQGRITAKAKFWGAGAVCAAALLAMAAPVGVAPAWALQAQTQAQAPARATLNPAPARRADEGFGPYPLMVIRGATLIDGTGAPPMGPVDIVIENDKITDVIQAGWPGMAEKTGRPPLNAAHEIDARGMYVMPGFVDAHAHGGSPQKAPDLEYVYKLWLAHGVTTIRGVSLAPHDIAVSEKARSARAEGLIVVDARRRDARGGPGRDRRDQEGRHGHGGPHRSAGRGATER